MSLFRIPLVALVLLPLVTPAPPTPVPSARIEVVKARRELRLFSGERLVKTYRVGLGLNPIPPKFRKGDDATPEGTYRITHKNPKSQYFLSLGVSYPGPEDARRAFADGTITKRDRDRILAAHRRKAAPPNDTPLGGDIFIHGNGSATDWTWGCIALDDADMAELYRLTPVGAVVVIAR